MGWNKILQSLRWSWAGSPMENAKLIWRGGQVLIKNCLCLLVAATGFFTGCLAQAQTLGTLHYFSETNDNGFGVETNGDGANPAASLILYSNRLYGTTANGGTNGTGTLFAVSLDGANFTILHTFGSGVESTFNFTNADGALPEAGLLFCGNRLYGTASHGGLFGSGTIYAVNTDGTGFTNIYSFTAASSQSSGYSNSDGAFPLSGLISWQGTLYGTTARGGVGGVGTVFAVTTNGMVFTNLHSFASFPTSSPFTNADGGSPYAGLIRCSNTLYGTTTFGGSAGLGTIFSLKTNGTDFTNLWVFGNLTNGAYPYGGLVLCSNVLYGTTYQGGIGDGTVFAVDTDGTDFHTLHTFNASDTNDSANPGSGLVLAGNTLFGTTVYGAWYPTESGSGSGSGKIFAVNMDGTGYTNLQTFAPLLPPSYFPPPYTNSSGANPDAGVVLAGDTLYGTTSGGGISGNGTIFSLNLAPSLNISISGPQVVLAWPEWAPNFGLQATTNLTWPAWTNISTLPAVVNGLDTVTDFPATFQEYYRLIQQTNSS